jgi:hypothetical protein
VQTSPVVPKTSIHEILRDPSIRHLEEAISYTPLSHVISVFHNNKELTDDLYPTIKDLVYTKPLKEKLQKDNSWGEDEFQSVDWDAFHTTIRRTPRSHRISITKLSHQLWNTNLQNNKYYNQSDKCPICQSAMEDINHLFHCPHPSASNNRTEAIHHHQNHPTLHSSRNSRNLECQPQSVDNNRTCTLLWRIKTTSSGHTTPSHL